MRLGKYLVMRRGPLIGYTSATRKSVTCASRYPTLDEAIAFVARRRAHRDVGAFWIAAPGAAATVK